MTQSVKLCYNIFLIIMTVKKISCLFFLLTVWLLFFPHKILAAEFNSPPTRIIIPKISLNLPVFIARISYNTWEVRTDGASFGEQTTYPGNIGNTVIFSHAMPGLFIDLPSLVKNDYIHIFTATDWFVYKVTNIMIIQPENIDVIFSNNKHELTLFTCTGENYSQRFVVKAILISDTSNSF